MAEQTNKEYDKAVKALVREIKRFKRRLVKKYGSRVTQHWVKK